MRYGAIPAPDGQKNMTVLNLGTRVVNNYLISSEARRILIDTGYAGGFSHFMKMLNKNRIRPEEIRFVFLTHAHDDHAGFLNEVLAATGADVILHPKAIEGLKRGQNSFEGGYEGGYEEGGFEGGYEEGGYEEYEGDFEGGDFGEAGGVG